MQRLVARIGFFGLVTMFAAACGGGDDARPITGHVVCWGLGRSGQIGDGKTADRNPPTVVAGVDDVRALFGGETATCGARPKGGLACWGDVRDGDSRPVPSPFAGVPDAAELAFGGGHTCARAGGQVSCWGRNLVGQLGNGTAPDPTARVEIHLAADGTVTAPGMSIAPILTPVAVTGLADATQLAAGGSHTCALRAGGTVVCWGLDDVGQLGDGRQGHSTTSDHPVAVAGLTGVVAIAAAGRYSCARLANGGLACWGSVTTEFPTDGSQAIVHATPTPVAGLDHVLDVAIQSNGGACAIVTGGDVRCWGSTEVVGAPVVHGAAQLVAGMEHTCARLVDGRVTCWGSDQSGELGVDPEGNYPQYTPVARLDHVTQIVAGARHVCALRSP